MERQTAEAETAGRVFIIVSYDERYGDYKKALSEATLYCGLTPILAEHDTSAREMWGKICGDINRCDCVLANFIEDGQDRSVSLNIALELGFAFAVKPPEKIGIFCRNTGVRNALHYPRDLWGIPPVEYITAEDLRHKVREWLVLHCPVNLELGRERIWRSIIERDFPPEEAEELIRLLKQTRSSRERASEEQLMDLIYGVGPVTEELRKLPPEYRLALFHYWWFGYTVEEIALALDTSPEQVKNWLRRGKTLLEAHLQRFHSA